MKLLRTLGLLLAAVTMARAAPQADRPNLVYILADDLGIGDVSCYNPHSAWQTPNLDRLGAQGAIYTDAHAASALCTPSRYALLTGRYPWRSRLKRGVVTGYERSLIEPDRLTVPEFLRAQGYVTAMLGKWHLGLDWARTGPHPDDVDFAKPFGGGPTARGFDQFLGISASLDMPPYVWLRNDRALELPAGRIGNSAPPRLWRAGPIGPDFHMEDVEPRLIREAASYLRERAAAPGGHPFFLYLALTSPHTPLLPLPEFQGRTHTTAYGDFVVQTDAGIGQLMAELDRTGLAANTLVVVTSDNGFAPAAGLPELLALHHDPSDGYRGYKSDLFEGGHRIPFIVRWPGHTPAGTRCAETMLQSDLFATCAELLGAKLPPTAAVDSVSILSLLCGQGRGRPVHEAIVDGSGEGRFTIRQGRWKLLLWPGSGGWSSPTPNPSEWLKVPATDLSRLPKYQLYDLTADPAERHNLLAEQPEVVQRLGTLLRHYVERGRSTPGPAQPVSLHDWPELSWIKDFGDGVIPKVR